MVGNRLTINDDEIKKLKGPIVFIASYKSHIDTYAIALALKDYKIKYVVGIEELPNRFSEPWKELGYISRIFAALSMSVFRFMALTLRRRAPIAVGVLIVWRKECWY